MTEDSQRPSTDVLGALPRSRPHRRSAKRPAPVVEAAPPEGAAARRPRAPRPAEPTPKPASKRRLERPAEPAPKRRLRQPPQPRGLPPVPPHRERPEPEESHDLVSGTLLAAAELTEISITASTRILRAAVSWLPKRR